MAVLSVLTAAIGEWAGFVVEAGESVGGQELPEGWELEWVVREDGPEPSLAEAVGRFPFARYAANGQRLGVAATRSLGLTMATGELVHVLDCDDLIVPGGLATVVRAFQENPEIHWVAAQADNLMPDGERVSFEPIFPTGYVDAGVVGDFVLEHGKAPFLPNGATMRTETVRALGGWPAIPTDDETALLVACGEVGPGYYPPEVVWLYRQHETQTSRKPGWRELMPASFSVVTQRIAAIRAVGLRVGGV